MPEKTPYAVTTTIPFSVFPSFLYTAFSHNLSYFFLSPVSSIIKMIGRVALVKLVLTARFLAFPLTKVRKKMM